MFWHNLLHAKRVRALLIALLSGAAVAMGAGGGVAVAGTDTFCVGSVASGEVCPGPVHTLTASRGTNESSGSGCGGALNTKYACATPAGCHSYAGVYLRTPAIRHRSSTPKNMRGYSTWGSTPQPTNCDPGSWYGVEGPVSEAAVDLSGVPVLERKKEQAPAAVAALWPTADASKARRFSTPDGEGWVLVVPADRKVCVAVEDPIDGYGYSCQSYADARGRGALTTLEDDDATRATGDLVVAIVAEGSQGLVVSRRDGTSRTVAPQAGVVAVELGAGDVSIALDAGEASELKPQKWSVGRR